MSSNALGNRRMTAAIGNGYGDGDGDGTIQSRERRRSL